MLVTYLDYSWATRCTDVGKISNFQWYAIACQIGKFGSGRRNGPWYVQETPDLIDLLNSGVSVGSSVRTSTKSFFSDFDVIWYVATPSICICWVLTYPGQCHLPLVRIGIVRKCHVPNCECSVLHSSINNSTSLSDSLLNDIFIMSNIKCNFHVECLGGSVAL